MGLMSRGWAAGEGGRNVSSLIRHLITGAEDNGGPSSLPEPDSIWQTQPSFVSPTRRPHIPIAPHKIRFTSVIEMKQPVHGTCDGRAQPL